jgi:uncharacterized protein (TIGR02594 family)
MDYKSTLTFEELTKGKNLMKKLIFLLVAMLVCISYSTVASAEPKSKPHHYAKSHKKVKKQQPPKVDIRTIKLNEMLAIYSDDTSSGFFALEKAREEFSKVQIVKVKKPEIKQVYTSQESKDLVEKASKYLGFGPNQLGLPRSLWCADFMNMLVGGHSRAAASYLNRGSYAKYGCVNCVAILKRRGGNHVGVVSGYDDEGDPIIISGNHDGVVGIGKYRRERVIGYRVI